MRRKLQGYADIATNEFCPTCTDPTATDTSSKTVVTVSKPTAFPSALRAKRSEVQTLTESDVNTTSVIRQDCAECGREEVRYYTQQLRSADEGSTVFYECECGHKYVLFNLVKACIVLTLPLGGTPTTEPNAVLYLYTQF